MFGIISFLTAILGFLKEDMVLCGVGIFCSLFAFMVAFITEPRSRKTNEDKKYDNRCQSWGTGMLLLIAISAALVIFMSSCSNKGYGCRGNQSWNKIVKRIN